MGFLANQHGSRSVLIHTVSLVSAGGCRVLSHHQPPANLPVNLWRVPWLGSIASSCVRYNIFDEAIAEVLKVMEVNFKADFERTMEFRRLTRAVEREARELAVLRQVRLRRRGVRSQGDPLPPPPPLLP